MNGLDSAILCAIEAHFHQKDKGGQPYILHALSVMFRVRKVTKDETTQIVALLHDAIEDSDFTIEDARRQFGEGVACALDALTRREGEGYDNYIERVKRDPIAATVKAADLLDNLDPDRPSTSELASLRRRYERALESAGGPRMLTSRLRDTLAHIAEKPRRLAGLSHNHFYVAQSLYMQGLVAKRFLMVSWDPDTGPKRDECYQITDEGREELKQYDIHRSSPDVPPTRPAA